MGGGLNQYLSRCGDVKIADRACGAAPHGAARRGAVRWLCEQAVLSLPYIIGDNRPADDNRCVPAAA